QQVARFTRACWYDRAGYGWSDPGPFPQHSDRIAHDLHALLHAARVLPPYLLVAHGMGAFHARVFHGFYPRETFGLVLIDPVNEDMTIHIHNHIEFFRPFVVRVFETIGAFGGWRLFADEPRSAPPGYSLEEWKTIAMLNGQTKSNATMPKEPPLWIDGELARASGKMGSIPLIVLSGARPGPVADEKLEDHELTLRLNRQLAAQSARGLWWSVDARQNRMRFEAPAVIASAVKRAWRSVP
ncbi:MAG TPA: alpha/beta hydrolase, partial [Bryobacteraceae bacterium]|nr:alpha/beta hydrolase [Bryobacteraceae bacterium]